MPDYGDKAIGYVNEEVEFCFTIYNSGFQTGRAGSVSSEMVKNGARETGITITISEVDSSNQPGVYECAFTPDAIGTYTIQLIDSTNMAEGFVFNIEVIKRQAEPIIAATLNAAQTTATFYTGLKLDGEIVSNPGSATLTVYDASGTSVFTDSASTENSTTKLFTHSYTSQALSANAVYTMVLVITDSNGTSYTFHEPLRIT